MSKASGKPAKDTPTLSLKIGQWFEANASGWGVLAVPVTVLLVLAAALLRGLI